MMRYAVILLVTLSASASAQQPAKTCAELPAAPELEAALPAASSFKTSKPVTIEVHFSENYGKHRLEPWTVAEQQAVCAATKHIQEVWSSVEFQEALHTSPDFTLNSDAPASTITGDKLYAELTGKPAIVLTVAITDSWFRVRNCAVSDPNFDNTAIQRRFMSLKKKPRCGQPPLLPALTNTLAHEYTHYRVIASTDRGGDSVNNTAYVSYGIGCITQNLAFPKTCTYTRRP